PGHGRLAGLRKIALAESGPPLASPAAVDVGELAAELVELFEPVAGAQGLTLDCHRESAAVVQGNRQLLAQLLTNLIENGLKYVPAGGRIEVAARKLAHRVSPEVGANRAGLAASDRSRAGQRFVRFGSAAKQEGSGLGLSLAAAIARLDRGRLPLESSEGGLRVVVELPA